MTCAGSDAPSSRGGCFWHLAPAPAYVNPSHGVGKVFELGNRQLDGAVAASAGRKHGGEPLQGLIEIDGRTILYGEGADSAHGVSDQIDGLLGCEHARLGAEALLECMVVDTCIAGAHHEQRVVIQEK